MEDLLTDIERGEIKVPKFQRPFVWRLDQALALLDSLASGYPVGSVLLWRTVEKLRAERNIGDFALPETDEMTPTKYVLDGQQRLTVMYSSFGAKPDAEGFTPFYDLSAEKFISSPPVRQVHHFPLRLTYRTTDLLNFRTALQALGEHETYQERLDALIGAITGYRLPVVELRDLSVEEVCPIFERINSSGTKLSTFDLIAAATWTQEFDLSDQSSEIAETIKPKGFDGVSNETVLKCIAACLLGSVKKEDVLSLRGKNKEEIINITETVKSSMMLAIDFLFSEFKIQSMSFLPYEAQLISLVKVFSLNRKLSSDQVTRLRQWFWRSSFLQYYRGASEAFVSKSFDELIDWIFNEKGRADNYGVAPDEEAIINETFHFRGATSKALVLTLARKNPKNLMSAGSIDVGESLSSYNKKQFHHVFPQAYLKRIGVENKINSFANICMLSAQENNSISDADPNVYLPEAIAKLGGRSADVFRSALMPDPEQIDYSVCSFDEFLSARSILLKEYIRELCDGNG
tara:strand:+ start:490 stop:2043 length:1554 start_codon:yes stop_codon:yes gene_type:complete